MSKRGDISNKDTSFDRAYLEKLLADKQASESLSHASKNVDPEEDPFMAEALEGFNESSPAEVKKAISELDEAIAEKTGYRIGSRKGFAFNSPYFMVAASTLLLAVAAIFIFRPSLPENTTLSQLEQKEQVQENSSANSAPIIKNLPQIEIADSFASKIETEEPEAIAMNEVSIDDLAEEVLTETDEVAEALDNNADPYTKDALSAEPVEEIIADSDDLSQTEVKEEEDKAKAAKADNDGYISAERGEIKNVRTEDIERIPSRSSTTTKAVEVAATRNKSSYGSTSVQQAAASYPGGMTALQSYLTQNTKYPKKIDKPVSGKVLVSFVIDDKGRVKDAKVISSIHPDLDKEALRVVKNMPKWSPAIMDGKKVSSSHNVHVVFQR